MADSATLSSADDGALTQTARHVREIVRYERETQKWYARSRKILERYKDNREDSPAQENARRFNILWSMVQTIKPALYSRNPKPDIQRRFKDSDPIGRVASDVMERCVSFFTSTDAFKASMQQTVMDYLLPGRGVVWHRYVPHITQSLEVTDDVPDPDEAADGKTAYAGDNGGSEALPGQNEDAPEPGEQVEFEEVLTDYVNYDDFGHNIARTFAEVWLGWRRVYMTRKALIDRFGEEKGKLPPLDYRDKDVRGKTIDTPYSKAVIYEVWDKESGSVCWLHKDVPEYLDEKDDFLGLADFFPFPRPLLVNLCNDSLIPTPDYAQWQDQAIELDALTNRIGSIQKSLKVAGVYNAAAPGIARVLAEGVENQLIPVEKWAIFGEQGGLKGAMQLLPLAEIAAALEALYQAREQTKAIIYEVTGVADIIRGQSDPNETMGAQQIKSNFATLRLSDRQSDVQVFVRNAIVIIANIICNHFQDETIKAISGVRLFTQEEKAILSQYVQRSQAARQQQGQQQAGPQMPPPAPPPFLQGLSDDQVQSMALDPSWEEVLALIHDQPMRNFRIDIETDSIIKADEEAEKASRVEFLQAAGGYLTQAVQAAESYPQLAPLAMQMLMFGIRAFPVGKELEGSFNAQITKLEQQLAQNPQGNQKPDPAMAKVQAEAQLAKVEMQAKMQLERDKQAAQAAGDQHRNELEAQRRQLEQHNEMAMKQMELQANEKLELQLETIRSDTAITVAQIGAQNQAAAAEMTAKTAADEGGADSEALAHLEASIRSMAQGSQAMHDAIQAHVTSSAQHMQAQRQALADMSAEKEIVRDDKGKAIGVRRKVSAADATGRPN